MKPCDLNSGAGRLARSFATLRDKWMHTKGHWRDEASRQFEEEHLQPLPVQLQLAFTAIGRLAEVLEKAESDCADPDREPSSSW